MTSKDTALINGTNGYGGGKNRLKSCYALGKNGLPLPHGLLYDFCNNSAAFYDDGRLRERTAVLL